MIRKPMDNKEFKRRLKRLGLRHEDFASQIGVVRQTVTGYSTGSRIIPGAVEVVLGYLEKERKLIILKKDIEEWMRIECEKGKRGQRLGDNIRVEDIPEYKNVVRLLNELDEILSKVPMVGVCEKIHP